MTETASALDSTSQSAVEDTPGRGPARKRTSWLLTIIVLLGVVYFLLPLWWLLVASTKSNADLFSSFGLWFANFNLFDNIKTTLTFDGGVFVRWAANSVIYAVVSAVGASFLATIAGYGVRQVQVPWRDCPVRDRPRRGHGPGHRARRPDVPAVRARTPDRHLLGGHPARPREPVRRLPDAGLRRRRRRQLPDRGRPDRRGRRDPDLLHHRTPAAAPRIRHGPAVHPGGDLEQLLPAAHHAQLAGQVLPVTVGLARGRRPPPADPAPKRLFSTVDHRVAAVDHSDGRSPSSSCSATGSPAWPPAPSKPDRKESRTTWTPHVLRCCSAPPTTTSTSRALDSIPTST